MNAAIELPPEVTALPASTSSAVEVDRAHQLRNSAVNDSYADLDAAEAIIDCVLNAKPTPLLLAARHMVSAAHAKGADAVNAGRAAGCFATFLDATHGAAQVLTTAAEEADDRALWGAAFLAQRAEQVLKDAEVDEPEAEEPDRELAEALRPLVSALSVLIYQAEQISLKDDPRDLQCDAARLLNDAEAMTYGLANAPSTDYFWQVASTQMRAALRMVQRTLQQALDEPAGLGIAQMAMLPAAITLAGRLVAVLDLVEPDEQMQAVRELETALRTGGLVPTETKREELPIETLLTDLHDLTYEHAEDLSKDEGEALYAVALLCEIAQRHVAASRIPGRAIDSLQEALLTSAQICAVLTILNRTLEDRVVGAAKRLAVLAEKEICEMLGSQPVGA
ncbi:hypothetical protein [uncultured Pseudacidovorax sp.]|uniref:hypothetical protein n=1 Tax=uncultured Pseudacidovorax sp. TaxID=679313 RepID=UPI0025CE3FA6|nr:hypothetical protein [uncultured Pseudacidovorax sp.]